MNPQPKSNKYRNSRLTQSAQHEACVCHGRTGTTVWAHSNKLRHGKGKSTKAHDLFGVYMCFESHTDFDQLPERKFIEIYAMTKQEWFIEMWERSMLIACEKNYL